ncbi:hypothetical protein FA95DRAFT_1611129, partial [Auriscalpium vulgare]
MFKTPAPYFDVLMCRTPSTDVTTIPTPSAEKVQQTRITPRLVNVNMGYQSSGSAESNKLNFVGWLAKLEARKHMLATVRHRLQKHDKAALLKEKVAAAKEKRARAKASAPSAKFSRGVRDEPLPFTDPATRYHIAQSTSNPVDITSWLSTNRGDPALK